MRYKFRNVELKKPKVNWEKDEATGRARPIASVTFEVPDLPAETVQQLATYALYGHLADIILTARQASMPLDSPHLEETEAEGETTPEGTSDQEEALDDDGLGSVALTDIPSEAAEGSAGVDGATPGSDAPDLEEPGDAEPMPQEEKEPEAAGSRRRARGYRLGDENDPNGPWGTGSAEAQL